MRLLLAIMVAASVTAGAWAALRTMQALEQAANVMQRAVPQ